ncbi:MAG: type II secretion system protein, partial [Candidatus Saccharibacteria bacterium]
MRRKYQQSGFTIVELLIVIVVIGILATLSLVAYNGVSQKATVASLQSDLSSATNKLKLYQVTNMAYPATLDCTVPPSANSICLKASPGNVYLYSVDNAANPQTFSLTETNNGTVSYIATESTVPTSTTIVVVVPINLTFNPSSTGRNGTIQTWIVPTTGTYTIEVWGAQGGNSGYSAGLGARMRGDFALAAGTTLNLLVGQQGSSNGNHGGGGGGTFVTGNTNNPLIIAGGGGGSGNQIGGSAGAVGSSGTLGTGTGTARGNPGTNGGGGGGAVGGSGGGGGGLLGYGGGGCINSYSGVGGAGGNGTNGSNGTGGTCYPESGGRGFATGGTGGYYTLDGGFGGGGGVILFNFTGGGGGGYSG